MPDKNIIIREATKGDLNDLLHIINEYQRYDVEFARGYYRRYFSNVPDEMTERIASN
jgi:hypothetical protein